VRLVLTPGQASDKTTFPQLIEGLTLARNYLAAVLMAVTRLWTRAYESTT